MNKSSVSVFSEWLDSYLNFEHTPVKNIFWLDSMEFLCRRFDMPQNSAPCFHVAGSKGKGSVSKMIACILDAGGYKTGLYSSPHIIDFRERIQTAAGFLPDEIYEQSAEMLMQGVDSIIPENLPGNRPLTWFELVTLFCFLCFRNARTDFNVFEVGLGGRLDATNVVTPVCSVITKLELEHTEFLGDTIEKIAFEKGGIIKNGIPCVVQKNCRESYSVIENIAREKNAAVIFTEDAGKITDFRYDGLFAVFTMHSDFFKRPLSVKLRMPGLFQAENALSAAIAVKKVLPDFPEEKIEEGLFNAVLPARFEIIEDKNILNGIKSLVLDGAHTVESVSYTMDTLKALFPENKFPEAHLLFACAKDKDVEDIARLFKGRFARVMLTCPGNVKESDMARMKNAFDAAGIEYCACSDYVKACKTSLKHAAEENALLLVTGSFYLVAEMKKVLAVNEIF